jgi:hypothetical protein
VTDVRQLQYEADREEWRRLHGLPGPKRNYGGRGDPMAGGVADPRLRSQVELVAAKPELLANICLPETANQDHNCRTPRDGVAR